MKAIGREAQDKAEGGPWSKVGEVPESALEQELVRLTGWECPRQAIRGTYMARVSGVRSALKGQACN